MISFKHMLTASLLLSAFLGFSAPLSAMDLSESIRQEALKEGGKLDFASENLTANKLVARLLQMKETDRAEITALSLRWCKLENLPANLATLLPNLRVLDLSCNKLERLPAEFALLPKLQVLVLDGNHIHQDSLLRIPASVQVLNLGYIYLERLPKGFTNHFTNLQVLKLHGNNIRSPESLLNIPASVQVLNLSENKLENLPEEFADHFPNLRKIYLSYNYNLKITPKMLKELANSQIDVHINDKIDRQIQALRQAKRDKFVFLNANLRQRMADLKTQIAATKLEIQGRKYQLRDSINQINNTIE